MFSLRRIALLTLAAGAICPLTMKAQSLPVCPAGNPLQALSGTWAFVEDGFSTPFFAFVGAAGRFTATVGADRAGGPMGVLRITESSGVNGSTTRLESDDGRFQINSDCTGGTLTFNLSSRPDQYDFYFVNADRIVLVSSNSGNIITGTAQRVPSAATCPANTADLLLGSWVFSYNGFRFPATLFLAGAGRFTAAAGPNGGVLTIQETVSIDGSPARYEVDAGRFQLNADCTGGQLTFNVSSRPIQFDFYFADPNTIVLVGSNNGDIITGTAKRFGSI